MPPPPNLTTTIATTQDDLVSALRLIADSVAQQRQIAANAIIFHPLWMAAAAATLAVVAKLLYADRGDWPIVGTTGAGCLMAGLVVVRALSAGYIEEAERVGTWVWLEAGEAKPDRDRERVVLVSRFGDRVIGALVLEAGVVEGHGQARTRRRATGRIRAWTVLTRYRRNGVGRDLLERAVLECRARGWEGPVFDRDHANSKRLVPRMFHAPFETREKWAKEVLREVVEEEEEEEEGSGGKRGRG